MRRLLRAAVLAGGAGLLLWLAREGFKRWVEGPEPGPDRSGWRASWETEEQVRRAAPEAASVPEPDASAPAAQEAGRRRGAGAGAGAGGRKPGPGDLWVVPDGAGEMPATHPVKAKLSSRLYRVPGMPMYDRSVPDRCYRSAEDAEADGFSRASR